MISNKYKILDKLSSGNFGVVYKGENIRTNEHVAIKIIKKDDFTKKYTLNIKNFFNELDAKEITKETFELCSNFYLIIIKALIRSQNKTRLKS